MKRIIWLISVVVAFCSTWTSATTTPNQVLQVVRDTNGEILRSDSRYFVVTPPVLEGGGGGVTRGPILEAQDANFVCPFQVMQTALNSDQGRAVFFKPRAPNQIEITESSDVNIKFYLDNPTGMCNNTVWEVEGNIPGTVLKPAFLSTNGGETGNPSKMNTWFQIKKLNDNDEEVNPMYILVFCPNNYEDTCSEITIHYVYEQRRLVLKIGDSFPVVFVKDNNYGIV
ncbi:miraculin-like [Solanum pennellii]|uniref:Miraculin-like n=1 Tax=Solanum pennellii TaxID=28526 RepID=A0ABM1GDA4_SOLPN|nr:miraculin-like [Solanum pennellii]